MKAPVLSDPRAAYVHFSHALTNYRRAVACRSNVYRYRSDEDRAALDERVWKAEAALDSARAVLETALQIREPIHG